LTQDPPVPLLIDTPVVSTCKLCKIQTTEEMTHQALCQKCSLKMEKAYEWLQGSLLSEEKKKALHKTMMDLTDISKIRFEDD